MGQISTIILTWKGENMEKEPRIMELRNQVWVYQKISYFSCLLNSLALRAEIRPPVHSPTVQNNPDNWTGCCWGEAERAWPKEERDLEPLFSCFTYPKASRYIVVVVYWISDFVIIDNYRLGLNSRLGRLGVHILPRRRGLQESFPSLLMSRVV